MAEQSATAQSPTGVNTISTVFNFQGLLRNDSGEINGACDFKFALYPALNGGNQIGGDLFRTNLQVTSGRFAAALDFGNVFTGDPRWLETAVRCPTGIGNYVMLVPRQEIIPAPYAMTAARATNIDSAPGDFTAKGILKSSRGVPEDGAAGSLQLENTLTGNKWQLNTGRDDDKLYLGFFNQQGPWTPVANFDRNGDLVVVGNLYVNGKFTSSVISNGVLRSSRNLPEDPGAGTLELENSGTNNKWNIHIPRDNDNLEFWFAENNTTWSPGMMLERNGNLHVSGDSLILANASKASGLKWNTSEAAIGWALEPGNWSTAAQAGDLVVRADTGKRLILGSGAKDHPAAVTVEASGLVSIPNLQSGGYGEANLQTETERRQERIARFAQGDVLCWDENAAQLEKCHTVASPLVVAIADANGKPLILGVEPIHVLGPVQAGELLIASATPGYAMAWEQMGQTVPLPGIIIAKALQSTTHPTDTVKAMILAR
ncbi:MAG: hypothetical protein U0350_00330 [Caldilineaceae bacterium]